MIVILQQQETLAESFFFAVGGLLYFTFLSFPSISIGFYCLEGSEVPTPCPSNTIRDVPGAGRKEDCLPCPPGRWCKAGGTWGNDEGEGMRVAFHESCTYP